MNNLSPEFEHLRDNLREILRTLTDDYDLWFVQNMIDRLDTLEILTEEEIERARAIGVRLPEFYGDEMGRPADDFDYDDDDDDEEAA